MKHIIFLFIILSSVIYGQDSTSNKDSFKVNESLNELLYSFNDSTTKSRLLLYDEKYVIHLTLNDLDKDSYLTIFYGEYLVRNDTIIFTSPDSLTQDNRYFRNIKGEFKSEEKEIRLYDIENKENPYRISRIHKKLFKNLNVSNGYMTIAGWHKGLWMNQGKEIVVYNQHFVLMDD